MVPGGTIFDGVGTKELRKITPQSRGECRAVNTVRVTLKTLNFAQLCLITNISMIIKNFNIECIKNLISLRTKHK